MITDEELQKIADWLKTDEDKKKVREALENNDNDKVFDKMRDIDPEKLREPFNI